MLPQRASWPRPSFARAGALHELIDPRQDATENIDLLSLETGASEEAAQARQQALWLTWIQNPHGDERTLALGKELCDLVLRGRSECGRFPNRIAVCGEKDLVGSHLHRCREIERSLPAHARDRCHDLTACELVVRKPRHLAAENQRDLARLRATHRLDRRGADGQRRTRELAGTCRETDREGRTDKRCIEVAINARPAEQGLRAGSERICIGMRELPWRDQREACEPHGVHCAR